MPDVDQYAPGTPSWVDLSAPDLDAAAAFYTGLFGWEAEAGGPAEETGGYRMFSLRGRAVAGLGPLREGAGPPSWTTYVTVADAEAACATAAAAGGTIFAPAFDVMSAGRMAVIADPQGAVFCVWQPIDHIGCEIVNEPGALVWNELTVRDAAPEPAFYGALFGWSTGPGPDPDYTTWMLGERPVGGMIVMDDRWPAEMPAHWLVYFAVEDADAACARTRELGGLVRVEPVDISIGRLAVLADTAGGTFAVIAMNEAPAG